MKRLKTDHNIVGIFNKYLKCIKITILHFDHYPKQETL